MARKIAALGLAVLLGGAAAGSIEARERERD